MCGTIFYIVSPVVKVDNTNYTAFIGSSITLACRIVYEGTPQASFQWRRHGLSVRDDHIVTNDTHTMLQLTNLTEEDHGMYRCVARWMLLTFDIHDVYLYTQGKPSYVHCKMSVLWMVKFMAIIVPCYNIILSILQLVIIVIE